MHQHDGRVEVSTSTAPPPAGSYSQGILASGLLFVSGQTPRLPTGERLKDATFAEQVRATLTNLRAVAQSGGTSLARALHVTVYLVDPSRSAEFDDVYREFVTEPYPARTLVQSSLLVGQVEIDAVLTVP